MPGAASDLERGTGIAESDRGAYGLRLRADALDVELLLQAHPDWPVLELSSEVGRASESHELVSEARAEFRLRNGGEIRVDRATGRVVFRLPSAARPDELVHPLLAPVAAVHAHWLGRESFHAAAFAVDGGVWALLGEREAGKSSMAAWLALNGYAVACDDLLVLDDSAVLPGPRVLDLRRESAEALGVGEELGVVGARERWRLRLGTIDIGLPLRGFVNLAWGPKLELARVEPVARLPRLLPQRGLRIPLQRPDPLLALGTLPMWDLRRPRGLDSLDPAAHRLLDLVRG